jgi:SAM-dependent methyltransferase
MERSLKDFFDANQRRWDESVNIHVSSTTGAYRLAEFRAGADILGPIEAAEVGDVAGKHLLHLQCHFGLDTLSLARRGATVTGLDFSPKAIAAARSLSEETGVPGSFVEGNVYDAPSMIDGKFDVVYVTWGAINWLPDIARWAGIVAHFLKPGGYLYNLEGHPAAQMLDHGKDGRLVPTYPYFQGAEPLIFDEEMTYTGDSTKLRNARSYEWIHALSAIINALIDAGLRLDFLNEHDRLAWKLFNNMQDAGDGMFALPPDIPTLPLAYSLKASKP